MKGRSLYVLFGLAGLTVLLLSVGVLQLDSLEERISLQTRQIKALGEATERMAGELERLEGGGLGSAAASDDCRIDEILHPEVENFLEASDAPWPVKGAKTDGVLRYGWHYGDPKGFNPLTENAAELQELVSNYVDVGLADQNRWTDPDQWHGSLACRAEVTDDFKEYTFYLRRGVKWHKPSGVDLTSQRFAWLNQEHEVKASDFVFALDMLLHPQVENGSLKNYYEDVDSYKAIDDYTFVVRWKKKTQQSIVFSLSLSPLPEFLFAYDESGKRIAKASIGLKFNQHWYNNKGYVGAGPYRFLEYLPGNRIVLERNEEFFGKKPAIKKVIYPIYTDRTLTPLKLKSKEIAFGILSPSQYREEVLDPKKLPVAKRPKASPFLNGTINCQATTMPVYRYLGWNGDRPLFKDAKVRAAMTHAFNREGILEEVFLGLGEVTTGPFLPSSGALDPGIEPLPFSLDKARALLKEAGWTDSDGDGLLDKVIDGKRAPFEFTMLLYNKPEYSSLANILKEDLLKVGIKMNVSVVEWSLMQKRMEEKNFDAYTGGWGLTWDTDPFQIWHSSQANVPRGSNKVGFRNKAADKLIEQLRSTFEPDKRKALLHQVHRIIHEAQPYSFFMVEKFVFCWRKEVEGVRFAKVRPIEDYRPWWVDN